MRHCKVLRFGWRTAGNMRPSRIWRCRCSKIREFIRSLPGGFTTLDSTIKQHLRRWFVSQGGIKVVNRCGAVEQPCLSATASTSDPKRTFPGSTPRKPALPVRDTSRSTIPRLTPSLQHGRVWIRSPGGAEQSRQQSGASLRRGSTDNLNTAMFAPTADIGADTTEHLGFNL